jgi:protease-4
MEPHDANNHDSQSQHPPAPPAQAKGYAQPVAPAPAPQQRRGGLLRWIVRGVFSIVLVFSLLINVYLILLLFVSGSMGAQSLQQRVVREGDESQVIAVWNVTGAIMGESVEAFRQFHREVVSDQNIKAIVLRVDSPGGGVASSDEIYAMVRDIQQRGIPVVVSMGGLAASGGYYIAAPADVIYAEHGTATGSIGVIAQIPNFGGTAEKIGLEMEIVKSSHAQYWKDMLSPFRGMEPRERKRLVEILDAMQNRFEVIVRSGRGDRLNIEEMTFEATLEDGTVVERTETAPFNGMIYTAEEAHKLGLVDEIGYIGDAYDRAAELIGVPNAHIVHYGLHPPLMAMLFGQSHQGDLNAKLDVVQELRTPRFMYMCTLR